MVKRASVWYLSLLLIIGSETMAQHEEISPWLTIKNNTTISGQYFMGFYYDTESQIQNFTLKRGYFGIRTKLNETFSIRYTQDITLDQEGSDAGNVEIRLKYLYLKANLSKLSWLAHSYLEFGMVQRPWLELEQHINQFRVQGPMFLERYGIIGSADFGLTLIGLLGGEMDQEYRERINDKDAGRYGSYAIGLFNGGGYHAIEQNSNKTIESRITLRPFPDFIPGFQVSHGFAYGLGNNPESNQKFLMNVWMISSETRYYKATAQYYSGFGNDAGTLQDGSHGAARNSGYSFFTELYIPGTNFSLFGRFDDLNVGEAPKTHYRAFDSGIAYRFLRNKVLVDWQRNLFTESHTDFFELALEIGF